MGELPEIDAGAGPAAGELELLGELPDIDAGAGPAAPARPEMDELPSIDESPAPQSPAVPTKPPAPAKGVASPVPAVLAKPAAMEKPPAPEVPPTPVLAKPVPPTAPSPGPEAMPDAELKASPPAAAKPAAAPVTSGVRVSAYFDQGPAGDPHKWVDEGFNILSSIARANHSGEEIGANLDKFKDALKLVISYCQSMFPMTRKAHELKKKKEPLDDGNLKDLLSELSSWKAEVISKIK